MNSTELPEWKEVAIGYLSEDAVEALAEVYLGKKLGFDVYNRISDEILIPACYKITKTMLRRVVMEARQFEIMSDHVGVNGVLSGILSTFKRRVTEICEIA